LIATGDPLEDGVAKLGSGVADGLTVVFEVELADTERSVGCGVLGEQPATTRITAKARTPLK
jgi:hypothetical protein